jgi:hypothetical protein
MTSSRAVKYQLFWAVNEKIKNISQPTLESSSIFADNAHVEE